MLVELISQSEPSSVGATDDVACYGARHFFSFRCYQHAAPSGAKNCRLAVYERGVSERGVSGRS